MIFKRFNKESFIEVNGMGGAAKEIFSLGDGQILSGEGDFFGEDLVALYVKNAKIFILAKNTIVDVLDSSLVVKYEHIDGGVLNSISLVPVALKKLFTNLGGKNFLLLPLLMDIPRIKSETFAPLLFI
ncbi:hypothetical protein [Achromobacter pulmonis]|uniref:hypothetical protein n=1 Tax=Achromobacter pulmonis TaxID=1389932 RepID=UPI001C2E674C|nr:hypothetical protein [Achromobacter pulmonis]